MTREELRAWLRLGLVPGLGNAGARRLLAAFGLPQAVFAQSDAALAQVARPALVAALREPVPRLEALVEATWAWREARTDGVQTVPGGVRALVSLGDPRYPASLLELADPPLLLHLQGRAEMLETSAAACLRLQESLAGSVSIVGSRNPSAQGLLDARGLARALREAGLCVVSGLAAGIDGAAHEGALSGGSGGGLATVAVIGTGPDQVYPRRHLALARRIASEGLLISEYLVGTPPLAPNFPRRNRLIAALSRATLVVEAALRSGSLITAAQAAEMGKDVLAVPGSIHSAQSRGCHALIKQGARLVETVQDVLEEMNWEPAVGPVAPGQGAAIEASRSEPSDPVLTALGFGPAGLDALQTRTGLDTAPLQARLMALEFENRVARLPGGLFQRLAPR